MAVLLFFQHSPRTYAILLLINVAAGYVALAVTRVHRAPPFRIVRQMPFGLLRRREFWSPQLRALLAARGVEITALLGLSHIHALSPVLSLKIGLAISQALAINARAQKLTTLLIVHLAVYSVGTAAVVLAVAVDIMPLPPTLALINPWNAVLVLPIVLTSFVLTINGLRLRADATGATDTAEPAT